MANKSAKSLKSVSPRTKGLICLVLLLAVTVFVSWLGITGMDLDETGVNVLLPWIPVSSENWPASLPVTRALGGGTYADYTYTIPEGASETALDDSIKAIRARLDGYGESDAIVTVKDGKIHLELREMPTSRRTNIEALIAVPYKFEFSSDDIVYFTQKDVTDSTISASYNSKNQLSSYVLTIDVPAAVRSALAADGVSTLLVTVDGSSMGYASVSNGEITLLFSSSDTNSLYNTQYFLKSGAVEVDMETDSNGTINASQGIVLKVVLWVSAALLALTLIYTIATGKLTGVAATLSVWCAVVLSLFLVATVVVPSIISLNVACLVAILLGIVVAMYSGVTRTDAISKQIGEGATPKAATKLGFKMTAKQVWIAHGVVMALAIILMIFAFSRPIGYCLAAGVLASAIAVVIMRAYQACFTAISTKPSLFGKVK